MLTLFACPKAFRRHAEVIQTNAITSWSLLRPRPEIILFGNDPGTAEICERLALRHVPDVRCMDSGTPLLSDMFRQCSRIASNDVVCYINSDIILFDSFPRAIAQTAGQLSSFLLTGRRWGIYLFDFINFDDSDWAQEVQDMALSLNDQHSAYAMDYFAFRRGAFDHMPDFAIGRPPWDGWMIWNARENRVPVVDLSAAAFILHQGHGYAHAGGKKGYRRGADAIRNSELAGPGAAYSLNYATHAVRNGSVKRLWLRPVWNQLRIVTENLRYSFLSRTARWRHRLGLRSRKTRRRLRLSA